MSQLQMNKPSLPSIQFLLQEAPGPVIPPIDTPVVTTNKRQYGHRASRSVSSLPVDLQSLSLQAPEDMVIVPPTVHQHQQLQLQEPYNGIPFPTTEKTPSWMLPNDRPMVKFPSSSASSSSSHNRRKPSFAGHGRSVSEFTLPPLSSLNTPPSTTTTRRHASSHRRTVSANTVDFMLSPSPHHPPTTTTTTIRAQSYSPKEPSLIPQSSSSPPATKLNGNFFEQFENNNNNISNTNTSTQISADTSGRYVCPYCYKKFSRPSSLRIHTYSHTGEKPFVCTEPGCGRHFSVQSNMRRHLRVHRLGRGSLNSNNGLETTNEED